MAIAHAARDWAITHPASWALLYGSPVPGYHAPAERTVGPGTRVIGALFDAIAAGIATGDIMLTNHSAPQPISSDFERIRHEFGFPGDDSVIAKCFAIWAGVVGAISLEVFGQYGADTLSDVQTVFDTQVRLLVGVLTHADVDSAPFRVASAELERVHWPAAAGTGADDGNIFPAVSAGADAGLFCETMSVSFGSPVQTAWVTHDLDATETALTGLLGVKKWVRLPDIHFAPDSCSYLGAPADFVAHISLSYLGEMQFELIEPVRGPNIYSDFLQRSGPGLHHICVEADTLEDFDAALASAAEQGADGAAAGCDARRPAVRLSVRPAVRGSVRGDRAFLSRDAPVFRLHQAGAALSRAGDDRQNSAISGQEGAA